jgi:putative transposase
MWKPEHRRAAARSGLRYPSDLSDAEWAIVEPMIPPARHGGRKRSVSVREVFNGIFYVLWTGCQWKALPKGRDIGAHPSRALCRAARTRRPRSEPDDGDHRQPERQGSTKRGALLDPSGYDAGKKVKGRKRHILVDTLGLLLSVVVHPANIQDRDGAYEVLRQARRLFPFIERIFADGGYRGEKMALVVARTGSWKLEIVKRSDVANGFEVLPKRWIVERTFAWISRCRRLTRDFERYARTTIAFIRLAMIRIMLRRLVVNPSS